MIIEGHVAFVPVHVIYLDGTVARPNDPMPLPGHKIKQSMIRDMETMAEKIGATAPPSHDTFPKTYGQNQARN